MELPGDLEQDLRIVEEIVALHGRRKYFVPYVSFKSLDQQWSVMSLLDQYFPEVEVYVGGYPVERRRGRTWTDEQRAEVGRRMREWRLRHLTPEQRHEIAIKAAGISRDIRAGLIKPKKRLKHRIVIRDDLCDSCYKAAVTVVTVCPACKAVKQIQGVKFHG